MLMRNPGPRVLVLVLALALAGTLATQTTWRPISGVEPRFAPVLGFDPQRGVSVLFGGASDFFGGDPLDDTWTFDGATWSPREVAIRPPARFASAMAFDPLRQRLVLFGGATMRGLYGFYVGRNDTWEWDGTTWAKKTPATSPPPRAQHALAFDPNRGKVLLFGGTEDGVPYRDDLWEWDGQNWAALAAPRPSVGSARDQMVTDTARGLVVLVRGNGPTAEHWEWNGVAWARRTDLPVATGGKFALAFDTIRRRLQLVGVGPGGDEVWESDGSTWALSAVMPGTRPNAAVTYDSWRARTIVQSSEGLNPYSRADDLTDTWLHDGSAVTKVPRFTTPGARTGVALAADSKRRRVVLFGGQTSSGDTDEVWEWDGAHWAQSNATPRPTPRHDAMLTFDSYRGRVLLFGGATATGWLDDTWEWNGAQWIVRTPTRAPSRRRLAGMDYSAQRGRVLLFGGEALGVPNGETWEWDGTDWTALTPAASPSPRIGASLVCDQETGTFLLFGGRNPTTYFAETWIWNGTTWAQRTPAHHPPACASAPCAYDPLRRRIVLWSRGGTWEWDGTDWNERAATLGGNPPLGTTLAWDAARGCLLLIKPEARSHWEYGPVSAATASAFGVACLGKSTLPTLEAFSLPWLGDTVALHYLPAYGRPAFAIFGASRATWNGLPLPLDLAPLGMPGCALATSAEIVMPYPTPAPLLQLPIPADPRLVGATLYAQTWIDDPGANLRGATTTNALALRIGSR